MEQQKGWGKSELEWFRQRLEGKKSELILLEKKLERRALEELSASNEGEISVVRLHNADMASNQSDQETMLLIAANELAAIKQIDRALARLKDGKFGFCVACGCQIQESRLKVAPEAEHCLSCQADEELDSKARRRPHKPDEPDVENFELLN